MKHDFKCNNTNIHKYDANVNIINSMEGYSLYIMTLNCILLLTLPGIIYICNS